MIKTMNNILVNTQIDIQDLGKLLYKKTLGRVLGLVQVSQCFMYLVKCLRLLI